MKLSLWYLCFIVILALMIPAENVRADENADVQKEFSAWRDQIMQWRVDKLAEPDLPNELTFDDILPAPEDPELWPLWRDWLT